ncbi:MAG: hypothetical protein WB676_10060 [Bryobacteraceae bacterium]
MIYSLVLRLLLLIGLLSGLYFAVRQHSHGVLDSVKPQQVPAMRSAQTIRDYRQ